MQHKTGNSQAGRGEAAPSPDGAGPKTYTHPGPHVRPPPYVTPGSYPGRATYVDPGTRPPGEPAAGSYPPASYPPDAYAPGVQAPDSPVPLPAGRPASVFEDQTLDARLPHGGPRGPYDTVVHPSSFGGGRPGGDDRGTDAGKHIGPYRILEKVGEGGMGVVYRAEQSVPVRRQVAVKVIKVGMDTREVVARFEAERQALALMSHPNVARVLDAGATETGRPYFVMEYVPGIPLSDYCDENRLTVRQRLAVFCDVCHAVQHAHQKGVIHRDLKPSNILVSTVDGKPVPKVIDFGIAKATAGGQSLSDEAVHTMHGTLIGTPEYASPEQAITGGLDVDTRTDVYSLGVVLYQLLTGTLPLDAATLRKDGPEGIARVLREVEPPRPSTRVSQIRRDAPTHELAAAAAGQLPPDTTTYLNVVAARGADPRTFGRALKGDLDWITLTAMEKDRSRRYATAQDLAADVQRYLADEPILARPPSNRYRVAKFVRRHRTGVAAAALCGVLLAGGAFGTTAGMLAAIKAKGQAEQARQAAEQAKGTAEQQKVVAEAERARAQAALDDLRKARDKQVEVAVAALRDADRMLGTNPVDAERLALPAYGRVIDGLGQDDPVAWAAGDVAARAMLANGKPSQAVDVLKDVVRRAREQRPATAPTAAAGATGVAGGTGFPGGAAAAAKIVPRGRLFSDLADALQAEAHRDPKAAARAAAAATDLRREALAVFRSGPAESSPVQLDVGERLAANLAAAGLLGEAERAYEEVLADHRLLLNDNHPRTARLIDRQATLLLRAGRNAQALRVVKAQLARQQASGEGGVDAAIARRVDVADALLRLGKTKEGADEFAEAIKQARRQRTGADGANQSLWRNLALRAGLGSETGWRSQALRGNAWMAVDEALSRAPSGSLRSDEVRWGKVEFQLQRWVGPTGGDDRAAGGAAAVPVAAGTLDALKALPDPPPGVYLLSLKVPRVDGDKPRTTRAAAWVLMADWKLALFEPIPGFNPNDRAKAYWTAISTRPPSARLTQPSLLLLDAANAGDRAFGVRIGQGPNGKLTDWAATADATVTLPPGPYRVTLTSDDGARLHLDDRPLIDSWRNRPLQTDADMVDLSDGPHDVRAEYFQATGEYTLVVRFEPFDPAADALVAAALGADSTEYRRRVVRGGQFLERAGRFAEAVDRYAQAVPIGLKWGSAEQDTHLQAVRGLARSLAAAGRAAEVAPALEGAVSTAFAARPPAGDVAADTLLAAARARLAAGAAPDAARRLAEQAYDAAARSPRPNDPVPRRSMRRAVLARLGATTAASDGKLPAQLWAALDEAMLEDPALAGRLRTAAPGDVAWKLVRWDPAAGNPAVAWGTLASLSLANPVAPGAYLVQFELRTATAGRAAPGRAAGAPAVSGTAAAVPAAAALPADPRAAPPAAATPAAAAAGDAGDGRFAQWVLVTPWDTSVFLPDGEGVFDRFGWMGLTASYRAVNRSTVAGLASLDALAAEPAPDGPTHRFAFKAAAKLQVPPGRYRVLATAADGVRVTIGDRRLIYAWPGRQTARLEVADVDLTRAGPSVEVDYYRANAEQKLFVRVRPLDPAAEALARSLGWRPRPADGLVADQSAAVADDAYHGAAFAARGVLRVRTDPAAAQRDFAAATASDQWEPLFPQLKMAGALLRSDADGHRQAVTSFLPNPSRFPGKDRTAAGRSAVAVLLADRPPDPSVAQQVSQILVQATAPSPAGPTPPPSLFARALQAYRLGNLDQAVQRLDQAREAPTGAPGHAILCDLLRAMTLKGQGKAVDAREAYESALDGLAKWEQSPLDRWDGYDTFDWMAAQVLKRQAAAVLGQR